MSTATVDSPPKPRRRAEFHTLRVSGVERLCADAVSVTFEVPDELRERYDFRPGQSLTLRRGDQRRSYSICAARGEPPRIGVRLVDGGVFSRWLVHEVDVGDEIDVLPPTGRFTPDLSTSTQHVLIAAGSGITPVLSVASSLLAETDSTVIVVYGNRRSDTVMFADELADIKDRYRTRFQLVHVLSREEREARILSGRLDAAKLRALFQDLIPIGAGQQWWLCGPYGMVLDARAVLVEHGVPAERVRQELFYVEDVPPEPARHEERSEWESGDGCETTVILDGRRTTLRVPAEVPVLDAAQRRRADMPFACKGGVCGTCRAKVISGEVRMRRNFALEDAELDAGFVLTCQSLPTSDTLVVDYDA